MTAAWRCPTLRGLDARLGLAVGGAAMALTEIDERATTAERITGASG
jgi:hypothetical protein